MNAKVRILNLEDSARDSELIRLRLEAKGVECDLLRVETEADYLRALQQDGVDLIIADLALPSFDGVSALDLARQHRPEIPFIFFSGTLGEDAAIECFRKGATDYVLKQRPSRLVPAVERALHEADSERQRRRAEAALRDAEERLRHAHKWESIGILAGGVAHDFNNLLTVIMGNASLARAEFPSCKYYPAILCASERAANLTNQLLQYAGTGRVVVRTVDLTELVSKSTELFSAFVPQRVSLSFNLSKDLPCVEADPSRIEQILMNLVINAGEAIPPDRDGLIEVATSSCEVTPDMARRHSKMYHVAAGAFVCLEVRDNGAGMDEATISRIFDPFFSTKFTGRGLGMAAVYGIVRTSKGFIEVHSSPGIGTISRVFLPASEKTHLTEPAPIAPRQQPPAHATILVVDDEKMVRKLVCMTLARNGYKVLEAKDGKDALQVLAESPSLPSLILVDLAMPVMGGDELVLILEKKYPGPKIIVTSGYPEEKARRVFSSGSVAGFLQKPYSLETLTQKIAETLDDGPTQSSRILEFPRTA
jgi:two-component system, cell cycle sensor histidine kinase and response regulator CckA